MQYQWHIFLASLNPAKGSEQAGRRPVLVISRESINQILPVVNVIPLTSRKSAARNIYPNEVMLPADVAGLQMDSIALCYQIRTLDKSRLEEDVPNWLMRNYAKRSSRRFAFSWIYKPLQNIDATAFT